MISLLTAALLAAAPEGLVIAQQAPDAATATIGFATERGVTKLATLSTAPDYTPRGSVSPDGKWAFAVTVLSPRTKTGELSAINLATGAVKKLASDVLGVERPRATADGHTIFVRIAKTTEPKEKGQLSTTTTEIWSAAPNSKPKKLASVEAIGVNLAGIWNGQVLLYRVDATGASIWRVPVTGGELAQVAQLVHGPFARDFNVAGDRLIYATLIGPMTKTYGIEALELTTGQSKILIKDPSDHLAPLGAPQGIAFTIGTPKGDMLMLKDEPLIEGRAFALAANHDGSELAVRQELPERQALIVVHGTTPTELPVIGHFEVFGFAEAAK
ncbi:MAG: hypothetical protein JST54_23660 [Deltaproteobacteria bacterium]|nr:hypothetical protein [Deltaproteobacteria bacterium]